MNFEFEEAIEQIDSCTDCGACLNVCQIYEVSQNEASSPVGRLRAAKSVLQGHELSPEEIDGIYSCLKCRRCNAVCPMDIDIARVVQKAQVYLVQQGTGPLERPNRIMDGIQKLGNAVNADPGKKWDWLPEGFPEKKSDTLFYVGCVGSFPYPQVARSSYLLLKKLNVDFTMLRDEGCCGYFYYYIGRMDLAQEHFAKTVERFKRAGIKRIITVCAGCYHNFKNWYPELLGEKNFEVIHISQLLPGLLKGRKLKRDGREMTYHDPCGLGRLGGGIYDEPREALRLCGVNLAEIEQNRELSPCCGAMNINNFREISAKVAGNFLDKVKTSIIVTSCSFCLFGLNYGVRKMNKDKKILYLSEVILDSLS
jgi:Fe-S oxidoreductase